ncbi:hypothetical protein R6Q57_011229 [Mikania cordata]
MDYIPNMDDDSEGDRQHIVTTSKKQHRPQFIPPMSMNKFANLAKQHRMIGPKVIKTNVTKANYINVKAKRQLILADEDEQAFHEGGSNVVVRLHFKVMAEGCYSPTEEKEGRKNEDYWRMNVHLYPAHGVGGE